MKLRGLALIAIIVMSLCSSCSQSVSKMQNGYYTAEMASFDDHGWKEFITIYVSNNRITTVEYNAKNASGFIKSWDIDYMRTMKVTDGTYPNEYTRAYSVALLNRQESTRVDAVTGATHSFTTFRLLAGAAIFQAKAGDRSIAYVEQPAAVE